MRHTQDDSSSLWLTLGVYTMVFAAKLVAYILSGVMVLLAEALHTLSDIFISAFLPDARKINTGAGQAPQCARTRHKH